MGEIKKIFYSMGEVSEMLDVNPSLLRFWEKKFDILRPKKNKKGNRMFTPEDVRNLKIIYHLVKENGMTLAGAQKRMKQSRADIERDMELSERLHAIKALLLEVKQRIDDSQNPSSAIIIDGKDSVQATDAAAETNAPVPEPEAAEAETTPADVSDLSSTTDVPEEDTAAETEGEDMSDEDLEWEIETAFAAMNESEQSEDEYEPDMQESALFEEDDEDEIFIEEPLQQYDGQDDEPDDADIEPYDEPGDESGKESYSFPEDEPNYELNDNPEDGPEDEPETETILEEGMLFAVQAIKPKPVTEETIPEPQEPEPPVKENEKPRIIEQTLF